VAIEADILYVKATSARNVSASVCKITKSETLLTPRKAGIRVLIRGRAKRKGRCGRWTLT
jgi:hypothetical protein